MILDYDGEYGDTVSRIVREMKRFPKNADFPNQENIAK